MDIGIISKEISMAKCHYLSCNKKAMGGREGMPCFDHYMEEVHRLLDKAKRRRERERRIAKGKRNA